MADMATITKSHLNEKFKISFFSDLRSLSIKLYGNLYGFRSEIMRKYKI